MHLTDLSPRLALATPVKMHGLSGHIVGRTYSKDLYDIRLFPKEANSLGDILANAFAGLHLSLPRSSFSIDFRRIDHE